MLVETSNVKKVLIKEAPKLDPITVILEDYEPGKGKIIIECYGQTWSAYWGGMGGRTIAEFFCSADEHYIAGKLSSLSANIPDIEAIRMAAEQEGYDLTDDPLTDSSNYEALKQLYGDDWWRDIPEKANPDYQYLRRIIRAVQDALQLQQKMAA